MKREAIGIAKELVNEYEEKLQALLSYHDSLMVASGGSPFSRLVPYEEDLVEKIKRARDMVRELEQCQESATTYG